MPSVSTTAIPIAASGLIQNLGPDELYVGEAGVTASTGIEIALGECLSVGNTNSPIYAVSSGTSDVRILGRAMGLFSRPS